jgi:hypothetical protein
VLCWVVSICSHKKGIKNSIEEENLGNEINREKRKLHKQNNKALIYVQFKISGYF